MMKWLLWIFPVFVCLLALGACNDNGPTPDSHTTDPEEAMRRLVASDSKALETWKASLMKGCRAEDVFPDPNGTPAQGPGVKAIDARQFLALNGNSFMVFGPDGQLALLGKPRIASGRHVSRVSRTKIFGAGQYRLDAEARRDGAVCSIWLFGQKVYEAVLVEALPVVAAWDTTHAPGWSVIATPSIGAGDLAELVGHGFDAAVWTIIRPNEENVRFLSEKLNVPEKDLAHYFPIETSTENVPHAFTFDSVPEALPFSSVDSRVIGKRAKLLPLSGAGDYALTLRIAPPELKIQNVMNGADRGPWAISARVRAIALGGGRFQYWPLSVGLKPPTAFDDKAAAQCFVARFRALTALSESSRRTLAPSFSSVAGPCEALARDPKGALYRDESSRLTSMSVFAGLKGDRLFNYAGWDTLLRDFAGRVIQEGASLKAKLDPKALSPLLGSASDSLNILTGELKATPALGPVKDEWLSMAVTWALDGEQVTVAQIHAMGKAVGGTLAAAPESSHLLLASLADAPGAHDVTVEFAAGLSPAYKAALSEAGKLAELLGAKEWKDKELGSVLQRRVPEAEVLGWRATFEALKDFFSRELHRYAIAENESFSQDFKRVLTKALAEGWGNDELSALERISVVGRRFPGCEALRAASSIASCVGLDRFTRDAHGFFRPTFAGSYGALAGSFEGYMTLLPESDFGAMREELVKRFFEPVWNRCGKEKYEEKANDLSGLVLKLAPESNASKKRELEKKIRAVLENCR